MVRPIQSTMLNYKTLSKNELIELSIDRWACDQSLLWLWVTNSKDKKSKEPIFKIAFDLLDAWNFNYYITITWNKKTGVCRFGPYQIVTEHVLFAY